MKSTTANPDSDLIVSALRRVLLWYWVLGSSTIFGGGHGGSDL